jgi:hypothetical protein
MKSINDSTSRLQYLTEKVAELNIDLDKAQKLKESQLEQ